MVQHPSGSKLTGLPKTSDGDTWYQKDVSAYHSPLSSTGTSYRHAKTRHTVNGKPTFVTLPDPSSFRRQLVRHEIIALHQAVTLDRVEFYLSCVQIRIGDSQTGTPNPVSFPGAYNDNNPGIYDPSAHSPERHTLSPVDPYRLRNWPAVRERLADLSASPGGNSSPSSTAKNGKPTSTNGASTGSGSQPAGIAQSSLNGICKLRKHNAPTWASSISVTYALSLCMAPATHAIIPNRVLAFQSNAIASDLESFSSLFPIVTVYRYTFPGPRILRI